MDISIKNGEGISQAIKRVLVEDGIESNKFTGSIWSQIQQSLNDGESVIKHGDKETKIGELWTSLKQNVKTYVNDILKIADNTWNNIKNLFTGASGGVTNPTNPAPTNINPAGDNQPVAAPKITLKGKIDAPNNDLDKSQERIDKATSILAEAVNNKPNKIDKIETNEKRTKWCLLEDGTGISASYDASGKIKYVKIDIDGDYIEDVAFDKDVCCDFQGDGAFLESDDYDYNAILALAKKIFGDWDD